MTSAQLPPPRLSSRWGRVARRPLTGRGCSSWCQLSECAGFSATLDGCWSKLTARRVPMQLWVHDGAIVPQPDRLRLLSFSLFHVTIVTWKGGKSGCLIARRPRTLDNRWGKVDFFERLAEHMVKRLSGLRVTRDGRWSPDARTATTTTTTERVCEQEQY